MSNRSDLQFHQGWESPSLGFAREELARFLPLDESGWSLRAKRVHAGDRGHSFSVGKEAQGRNEVTFQAPDDVALLHAVYDFLETQGWRFEITGPVRQQSGGILSASGKPHEGADGSSKHPFAARRGIRQHINFTMDVSSYPLEEALEYLRNLARLRFNHITFHSYPGQFVHGPQKGTSKPWAGRFFYGIRHKIPDEPWKSLIRNREEFCIPELETLLREPEALSRAAVAWLGALMQEAKHLGFHVQFSFEPRDTGADTALTLATCKSILDSYPRIDTLELITQETGDWAPIPQPGALHQAWLQHFPGEPDAALHGLPGADRLVGEMGHIIRAASALSDAQASSSSSSSPLPQIALGVYCAIPEAIRPAWELLHAHAPAQCRFALLPGHGSRRVARFLEGAKSTARDFSRTTLYSWLEFDGLMYLQQNAVDGLWSLFQHAAGDRAEIGDLSMVFNHWRTAENRMAARYAAECCLEGPKAPEVFYQQTAEAYGFDPPAFGEAMRALSEAEAYATEELPNLGFCFLGCWGKGLGYLRNWPPAKMERAIALYRRSLASLERSSSSALPAASAGAEFLALMQNRVETTLHYLAALRRALDLVPLLGEKGEEGKEDFASAGSAARAHGLDIIREAISLMQACLSHHARQMPDRGSEGTLISLYHVPLAFLKALEEQLAQPVTGPNPPPGIGGSRDEDHSDAPPSPIQNEKQ